MEYQAGIIGKIYNYKLGKKQVESREIIKKEMEAFCQKVASKYGISRGTDLLELQNEITSKNYYYKEIGMKNEDAILFLEKERQEILMRRDAMFERIKALPVEGFFGLDGQTMDIGRRFSGSSENGTNNMLAQAQEHLENNGIDFPTEEYLQRIF